MTYFETMFWTLELLRKNEGRITVHSDAIWNDALFFNSLSKYLFMPDPLHPHFYYLFFFSHLNVIYFFGVQFKSLLTRTSKRLCHATRLKTTPVSSSGLYSGFHYVTRFSIKSVSATIKVSPFVCGRFFFIFIRTLLFLKKAHLWNKQENVKLLQLGFIDTD